MSFGFLPTRWKVCEVFGIPVYLDFSTVLLVLFFFGMTGSFMTDVAAVIVLLVSIVLHELGHALTARAFGCETRDITLSLIGGCASLERIPHKAWQELLTAVAGPAVSFLLSGLGFAALLVCRDPFAAIVLEVLLILNFTLGAFNLLPGFPMDGGRIFRSFMRLFLSRSAATRAAMIVGRVAAVLLVVGPFLGVHHIWIIPVGGNFMLRCFIAWMIWREGWREYQQALVEESWRGWNSRAYVSPPPYGGRGSSVHISKDED